jgi:CheY-specific phosphatase CheX
MTGDLTSKLQQAAASTFEQLGFLYADDELTEGQAALPVDAVAIVSFSGPLVGVLEVRIAGGLLPVLAGNMLGVEEAPEESVVMDAFGEVANVICGNVLPLVAGPQAVFDLGAPQVSGSQATIPGRQDGETASLSMGLEGGRADLDFVLREQAAD